MNGECTPRPCELAINSKLLKYKLNRSGHETKPCGTPDLTSTVCEVQPASITK